MEKICKKKQPAQMRLRMEIKYMKILSVTAQKPDSTGSGVYLTELVKEFDKMGHQQVVIGGVYENDKVILPKNVKFFPVYFGTKELPYAITGMSDEMPYDSTRYSDMTEEMTDQFILAFGKVIRKVITAFKPDVILCHHLYFLGSVIHKMYPEIKIYGFCHGSDLRQIKKNPWQRAEIIEQICDFDGIFALHQEQREQICEFYGCNPEKVHVIGTGYNSEVFRIIPEVKAEKNPDIHRYIFAGKLSEKKGVKSLLRALSNLKEPEKTEVVLAGGYGNQKEYEEIKVLAASAPCKVRFLGKLVHSVLAEEMNKSDVFVLPSFFEGLPLVNIETMACGLRVVCTDLPGIKPWMDANIPDNGVCFVTPPTMENEDEAVEAELPAFEHALALAMEEACGKESLQPEVIEKLSWKSLAERVIREIV